MNLNESFGDWLRQRRKNLDLTQAELADQVGCSLIMIRKIEANERRPSRQISERLADMLAISLDDRNVFINFARRIERSFSKELADLRTPSNLPAQSTPFIGRENELTQIADRLSDPTCRLLTLLGAGGIGKTRLALQAASSQIDKFSDGVFFISLTPINSTTFIAPAIATALDFSFYGQQDLDIQIINYLFRKHMLLILDNYEHLLGGITLLTEILAKAPRLKLLVTSRERLNMREEWLLPVEGLPFAPAVELFAQTARRVQPNFLLDANRDGIADIYHAVEGLPLGIELAASWLRVMSCQQIAAQIKSDLNFLTTSLRNIPERHRSLKAVFEHSWSLLSELERNALMKLSVFRGGIDAQAAEQIACASLSLMAELVDKSLVRLNTSGRYEMHELLRQYAADKLLESGQEPETRIRYLQFFLNLAERLERKVYSPQHLASLDHFEIEHDNFRAALDWASQSRFVEFGLQLAAALGLFWIRRTYWKEGYSWLETFLAAAPHQPTTIRAKALRYALDLAIDCHQSKNPSPLFAEAIIQVHQVEDQWVKAWLLSTLGFIGDYEQRPRNQAFMGEALAIFRQLGDQWAVCETLARLAIDRLQNSEFEQAGLLLDEGVQIARQSNDKRALSSLIMLLGCNNWYQGIINQQTERIYEESLELFHELRSKYGMVMALCLLGKFAHLRNEDDRARALFKQSLLLTQQIGQQRYGLVCLINLAEIFCIHNEAYRGTRIIGAVNDDAQEFYTGISAADNDARIDYERTLSAARVHLDDSAFNATFAEGQRMTLDEAVAYALADNAYAKAE